MTKWISFKIFDSEDYDDPQAILDKQVKKYYTIIHEDYFETFIRAQLEAKNG